MRRNGLAAALLVLTASAVQAKLEIVGFQPTYGPLGPVRKSLVLLPHDEIFFRAQLTGVTVDAEGKTDLLRTLRLSVSGGKVVFETKRLIKELLPLGGQTYPEIANFTLAEPLRPGNYTMTYLVTDNRSGETATAHLKYTAPNAIPLTLVAHFFAFDPDGKVAAPIGGTVGQGLYFRFKAIGFDTKTGGFHTEWAVQLLDAKGKDTIPRPLVQTIQDKDAERATFVLFKGAFLLNRAGEFTLRVTLTDRIAKKSARFEVPLRVTPP